MDDRLSTELAHNSDGDHVVQADRQRNSTPGARLGKVPIPNDPPQFSIVHV
jgi:hypothetical protein